MIALIIVCAVLLTVWALHVGDRDDPDTDDDADLDDPDPSFFWPDAP